MPIITTAIFTFILLIVIGIVVGVLFNRRGRSWLGRQVADATGAGDVTYSLVGIAGSFMGFHVGVILGLLPIDDALPRRHHRRRPDDLAVARALGPSPRLNPIASTAPCLVLRAWDCP